MSSQQNRSEASAASAAGAEEPQEEAPPQAEQRNPAFQDLLQVLSTQQAMIADLQRQILLLNQSKDEKPKDDKQLSQIAYYVQKFKDDFPKFNSQKSQRDVTYW